MGTVYSSHDGLTSSRKNHVALPRTQIVTVPVPPPPVAYLSRCAVMVLASASPISTTGPMQGDPSSTTIRPQFASPVTSAKPEMV